MNFNQSPPKRHQHLELNCVMQSVRLESKVNRSETNHFPLKRIMSVFGGLNKIYIKRAALFVLWERSRTEHKYQAS